MPFFTFIWTYPFVADGTISGINLWKTKTFKTQSALDPTTLLLGIYPTDTFPCAQNNMHEDTSYSIVCIVSNANGPNSPSVGDQLIKYIIFILNYMHPFREWNNSICIDIETHQINSKWEKPLCWIIHSGLLLFVCELGIGVEGYLKMQSHVWNDIQTDNISCPKEGN